MRSRMNGILPRKELQHLYQVALTEDLLFEDFGPKTSVACIALILAVAACLAISLAASARQSELSPQGCYDALQHNLPARAATLERRLVQAFGRWLSRRMRRRARVMAIDFHLIDYYGEPAKHRKELYRSKPKNGTSDYHAYATICIIEKGERYTLALTWVRAKEPTTVVIERLLEAVAEQGFALRRLLLDRGFFSVDVLKLLQERDLPFLMPVVIRGRKPKDKPKSRDKQNSKKGERQAKQKARTLRDYRDRASGRYAHTMKNGAGAEVGFDVVVSSRVYEHHRTKQRCRQKLLYAAWRVPGQPCAIRDHYRTRFGIESSYRQLEAARIRTCSRDPILRLFLVGLALLLRNIWVWTQQQVAQHLSGRGRERKLKEVTLAAVMQSLAGIGSPRPTSAAEDAAQQRLAVLLEILGSA